MESLCRQTFQINSNDFHIFVCVCTWIILFSKIDGKKWRIFTFHIWNHKNKANTTASHTMLFFINSSGILSNYTKLRIVQFLFNISYLEFSLGVLYNSLTIAWAEKCVRNIHSMIWWHTSYVPFKCISDFNWKTVWVCAFFSLHTMVYIGEFLLYIFEIHFRNAQKTITIATIRNEFPDWIVDIPDSMNIQHCMCKWQWRL